MTLTEKIIIGIVIWVAIPYVWILASFLYRRHRSHGHQEPQLTPLPSKDDFVEHVLHIVDRHLQSGGAL